MNQPMKPILLQRYSEEPESVSNEVRELIEWYHDIIESQYMVTMDLMSENNETRH